MPVGLLPDTVLTGPFWSEPVRVLTVRPLGEGRVRIERVGVRSHQYKADGQRLKPGEHLKLSQEGVAARCRTLAELWTAWADKDRREALIP